MGRGTKRLALLCVVVAWVPLAMGARGGCGGPLTSMTPAPDVDGEWAIHYDDSLDVEITIGGSTYDATLPEEGGTVMVEHGGFMIPFTLDCARPEIVCPSEAWPRTVRASQREPEYPHRMWVTIPQQECMGTMRDPEPNECGPDTLNPDCEQVCDGEVTTVEQDTFGLIDEPGESFDLLLGGGIATNGVNCVLLGISSAHADLESTGSAEGEDWVAQSMTNGEVVAAYGGGCLWAGDPDMDEELEALVLGASVKFTTGFTGERVAE
ncbi:MAG TPA: hypothetical protein RMH99_28200 [Sandaracinaceae bacterium LLY-WYZ-13_1]|nr:hypothetical protein [Sandaracinaceae bacterium LLY-WYZ-13_1]